MTAEDIPARLEYLRGEIRAERISYGELIDLQGLAAHIDAGDVELLEWAGVPEFPEDPEDPDTVQLSELQGAPGRVLAVILPRLPHDTAYLLAAVLQAGHMQWGTALLERHGYTLQPEDAPFSKGGALESTNPRVPAPFPRAYRGWTIDAPNVHGLYTATNYGAGYGQVAADTLQGIKHIITQTMAEGRRHE